MIEKVWILRRRREDHRPFAVWNTDLVETLELDNLVGQEMVTIDSRRQPHRKPRRPCPRGLPQPRRRQVDEAHPGLARRRTGKVTIDYRPVHTYTMSNDVEYIQPKARVCIELSRGSGPLAGTAGRLEDDF